MEEASNVLFRIGPLEVTSAVTTMWAIILVLTVLSWLATRRLKEVPGPLQSAAEIAVGKLRDYYEGLLGKRKARKYFPVFATFFIYIIVCNYSGLLPGAGHVKGFALPTASLSVTAGLATVAFFTTHVIGIRERGLKHYFLSFAQPLYLCFLMLPLNLIEQFVRPASLALRLYGNMYGEETVTEKLYEIFPIGVPLIFRKRPRTRKNNPYTRKHYLGGTNYGIRNYRTGSRARAGSHRRRHRNRTGLDRFKGYGRDRPSARGRRQHPRRAGHLPGSDGSADDLRHAGRLHADRQDLSGRTRKLSAGVDAGRRDMDSEEAEGC